LWGVEKNRQAKVWADVSYLEIDENESYVKVVVLHYFFSPNKKFDCIPLVKCKSKCSMYIKNKNVE
jgi:hypothetical protein